MRKAERILEFIRDFGPVSLVQVKRFAAAMNGHDPDQRTWDGKLKNSGYYSTNLSGTMHRYCPGENPGLLRKYCTKLPSGKWILTEKIEPPFYRMPVETKSFRANLAREKGEAKLREESWPVCLGCRKHRHPNIRQMPDKKACQHTFSSYNWSEDCLGRVWHWSGKWPDHDYRLTDLKMSDVRMIESVARSLTGQDYTTGGRLVSEEIAKHIVESR